MHETLAIARKEVLSEVRGKHGLLTTLIFAIMTVSAIGAAAARGEPSATLSSGIVSVAILFAAVAGLARTFIFEEEAGTGDLLRLWANPGPVFWGKVIYNIGLLFVVTLIILPAHMLFVNASVADWGLLICSALSMICALAAGVSVCGALVARAGNRGALAGVISIPVLLPVVFLGVGAFRIAFGAPGSFGWESALGLTGMAMVFLSAGPYLFAAVWKQ